MFLLTRVVSGDDQLLQEPVPVDCGPAGQGRLQGPRQPQISSTRYLLPSKEVHKNIITKYEKMQNVWKYMNSQSFFL